MSIPIGGLNNAGLTRGGMAGSVKGAVWTPLRLGARLRGWWDASDATTLYAATTGGVLAEPDSVVARWGDKSGYSRHLIQAASGNQPTRRLGLLNGDDGLEFGGSEYMLANDLGGLSEATVFVVASATTSTDAIYSMDYNYPATGQLLRTQNGSLNLVLYNDNGSESERQLSASVVSPAVLSVTTGATACVVRKNGVVLGSLNTVPTFTDPVVFCIGERLKPLGAPLTGSVFEALVVAEALDDAERELVEGYLSRWL